MSAHSKASLISEATTELTSYDIPLQVQGQSRYHDRLYEYDDLPCLGTTTFVNHSIQQDNCTTNLNAIFNHDLDDESSANTAISHGFFLGKESLQNLTVPTIEGVGCHGDAYDDDDTEDEGIGEIYRSSHDPETWVRRSDRSFKFKNSPEPTPRHALSPRIGNIGAIGQNIALGHRLGVLTEDASLIPKKVKLHTSHFVITEDSPVQTDVTWSKPDNASSFASLIYKIEVTVGDNDDIDLDHDDEEGWTQLGDARWPVLRIYHVENKLFIGKVRITRRKSDILIKIRVRSYGELVLPDRNRHWTMSSYSEIAEVTFTGYDYSPAVIVAREVQQTYL